MRERLRAGDVVSVGLEPGEKPMLIVLFSGACQSCDTELHALSKARSRLQDAKLDILALSIDGIATGTDRRAAEKLIAASEFPFPTGTITTSSADRLRFLLSSLHDFPAPFAVPLSLLLDQNRHVFAVYRGNVSTDLILHDMAFSNASPHQLRDLAVPFPGRWFTSPISPSELAQMVADPFHKTFPDHGLRYLEHALATASNREQAIRLRQRIGGGYYRLAWHHDSNGRKVEAASYYEKTLEVTPANAKARTDYGALLGNQGRLDEAEAQFRRALELDPNNQVARKNLDVLQQRRR